jgi:hypothetical protein
LPSPWKFRYYARDTGGDELRNEFDRASVQFRARLRSKLFTLSQLELKEWRDPLFKVLTDQDGISEIRFTADKVEQRPLGFLSGNYEYTFLLWAKEKNGRFIPRTACEIAGERRTACVADRSLIHDLWFTLE